MSARRGFLAGLIPVAVFLLLEALSLWMLGKSAPLQDIWLNRISHNVMAHTWGRTETIRAYFSLREQNEILSGKNFGLFKELERYKALTRQYEAALRLDTASLRPGFSYMAAEVTSIGRNGRHDYIILDKGSRDGVVPNSSIITPSGVVGMVFSVDEEYSYGLTLLNPQITVSARIGRGGVVAPLCWDGSDRNKVILKDIPLHLAVTPGDTVMTSGLSAVYPADIPIGVVEGSRLIDGAAGVVDVKLFEDFSSLRYVIIAQNPGRAAVEKLEEGDE